MFKENWPLTGLVKLLNPAGGRQLRLIRQGGGLWSWSSRHQDPGWAGLMCQAITRRNNLGVADQGAKKYNAGRHMNGSWMAKLGNGKRRQTHLWHGSKGWDPGGRTVCPSCRGSYRKWPTSRCSTSSLVKSVASSLNGSPSCTKPGRFRAPLGHSMPVLREKKNLWESVQKHSSLHHSQPGRNPHHGSPLALPGSSHCV